MHEAEYSASIFGMLLQLCFIDHIPHDHPATCSLPLDVSPNDIDIYIERATSKMAHWYFSSSGNHDFHIMGVEYAL